MVVPEPVDPLRRVQHLGPAGALAPQRDAGLEFGHRRVSDCSVGTAQSRADEVGGRRALDSADGAIRFVVLAAILVVLGCAGIDPRPRGSVVIYGRNDAPGTAWFGLALADPMQSVGFGPDIGVACLGGPAGTEIVSFDGNPGQGSQPRQSLGRVPGGAEPAVIWVEVAADSTLTSGVGVPPWWSGDPGAC